MGAVFSGRRRRSRSIRAFSRWGERAPRARTGAKTRAFLPRATTVSYYSMLDFDLARARALSFCIDARPRLSSSKIAQMAAQSMRMRFSAVRPARGSFFRQKGV